MFFLESWGWDAEATAGVSEAGSSAGAAIRIVQLEFKSLSVPPQQSQQGTTDPSAVSLPSASALISVSINVPLVPPFEVKAPVNAFEHIAIALH